MDFPIFMLPTSHPHAPEKPSISLETSAPPFYLRLLPYLSIPLSSHPLSTLQHEHVSGGAHGGLGHQQASDPSLPLPPSKSLSNKAPILLLPTCLSLPTGALSPQKGRSFGSLVARTSDWAKQEEDNETNEEFTEDEGGDLVSEGEEELGEGEDVEGGYVSSEGSESEEEYPEPPEEAKLFVGNLPLDMDSENLAQLFDQAGIVEVAEVIYNRGTDQSRGFGFVTMSTVEEAEKAIEMFNRYDCNGRVLAVNKAAPRGTRVERPRREFGPSYNIYVGNLPWNVDESRLRQVFSEHGNVVSARVILDRDSGRSRGFGFVAMSSQTEQEDAVAALDGQNLDGRTLRVNIAMERSRPGYQG